MQQRTTTGTLGSPNPPLPSGVGYIVIPFGVDRSKFILQCYRTNTVAMRTESGDFYKSIYISDDNLSAVVFPATISQFGSPVYWICSPKHGLPVVTTVFPLKNTLGRIQEENQFRLVKFGSNGSVEINGKSDKGELSIALNTKTDGKIDIKLISENDNGNFNTSIRGGIDLFCTKDLNAKYAGELAISRINDASQELAFIKYNETDKWRIFGDASSTGQPALLGDVTQTELNKDKARLDALITAITVTFAPTSADGIQLKAACLAATTPTVTADYSNIKSTQVKID